MSRIHNIHRIQMHHLNHRPKLVYFVEHLRPFRNSFAENDSTDQDGHLTTITEVFTTIPYYYYFLVIFNDGTNSFHFLSIFSVVYNRALNIVK